MPLPSLGTDGTIPAMCSPQVWRRPQPVDAPCWALAGENIPSLSALNAAGDLPRDLDRADGFGDVDIQRGWPVGVGACWYPHATLIA